MGRARRLGGVLVWTPRENGVSVKRRQEQEGKGRRGHGFGAGGHGGGGEMGTWGRWREKVGPNVQGLGCQMQGSDSRQQGPCGR